MATITITKKICDRCGAEICYEGWRAILYRKYIGILKLFYDEPYNYYSHEFQYELCAECTEKLKKFLKGDEV